MERLDDRLPIAAELPLNRVRRAMAKAMAATVTTAALSQVVRDVDLGPVLRARGATTSAPSVNSLILHAVATTLPRHAVLNSRFDGGTVVVPGVVNLGMAVATDEGLLVPVIHRADQLTLDEIDAAATDLAARARVGQLRTADVDAGTFTVSNLGMLGIDRGFALPPPPQAAILLVGRARPRPVLTADGSWVPASEAAFSLTFDHRFIDGATAAGFLADLAAVLAEEGDR